MSDTNTAQNTESSVDILDIFANRFSLAPKEITDKMISPEYTALFEDIKKQFGISEDEKDAIALEAGFVLLGFTPKIDLANSITKNIPSIDTTKAGLIASTIQKAAIEPLAKNIDEFNAALDRNLTPQPAATQQKVQQQQQQKMAPLPPPPKPPTPMADALRRLPSGFSSQAVLEAIPTPPPVAYKTVTNIKEGKDEFHSIVTDVQKELYKNPLPEPTPQRNPAIRTLNQDLQDLTADRGPVLAPAPAPKLTTEPVAPKPASIVAQKFSAPTTVPQVDPYRESI
jgi:hypothetical protein